MDPFPILVFLLFVLALAFFAGTEIPLMSVNGHKLEGFIRQKRWWARTLAKLKKNNERLLIPNLIGTLFVTSAPMIVAEKYITPVSYTHLDVYKRQPILIFHQYRILLKNLNGLPLD